MPARGDHFGSISMGQSIGTLPAEYNPKVHGPYNPGTYYGKGLFITFKFIRSDLRKSIFLIVIHLWVEGKTDQRWRKFSLN